MKNLLLVISIILFASCKKESTPTPVNPTDPVKTGLFSFNFSGIPISGDTYTCELTSDNYLSMGGSSAERPLPKTSFTVYLKMPTVITTGTYYSYTSGTINKIQYNQQIASNSYSEIVANTTTTGKLTFNILSYNPSTKAISCTFNGTMENVSDHTVSTVSNGVINGILK